LDVWLIFLVRILFWDYQWFFFPKKSLCYLSRKLLVWYLTPLLLVLQAMTSERNFRNTGNACTRNRLATLIM